MAVRTLLDHRGDILSQVVTDDSTPHIGHIQTVQRLDGILEGTKMMREDVAQVGHRKSRALVPVANIPLSVWVRACQEGWVHDNNKWRQWINDPQNKPFRITEGRL